MSIDHPFIDFDGDGHGDAYQTLVLDDHRTEFVHFDSHNHVDAIAYDDNHDGRIDQMSVDDNHDGRLDRNLYDGNGDGIMDHSEHISAGALRHPNIDFDGDGHRDPYVTFADDGDQIFLHLDGHGHIDREAADLNGDGLIDHLFVDDNHDGRVDRQLDDLNGDGIMDRSSPMQ